MKKEKKIIYTKVEEPLKSELINRFKEKMRANNTDFFDSVGKATDEIEKELDKIGYSSIEIQRFCNIELNKALADPSIKFSEPKKNLPIKTLKEIEQDDLISNLRLGYSKRKAKQIAKMHTAMLENTIDFLETKEGKELSKLTPDDSFDFDSPNNKKILSLLDKLSNHKKKIKGKSKT